MFSPFALLYLGVFDESVTHFLVLYGGRSNRLKELNMSQNEDVLAVQNR